jgi:type I restriction enzyme M protein
VLILQKKTQQQINDEDIRGTMANYNIFMAMVEKVGHDKRGNPLFKRDKERNEILVPDHNNEIVMDTTAEGDVTAALERKKKLEDDQTSEVPSIFAKWKQKEGIAW